MRMHAIQTGTLVIKQRQRQGQGHGEMRLLNTLLDRTWTEPLPIYAWVIEHPEGIIVVDTGETAHVSEPGFLPWWNLFLKWNRKEFVSAPQEIGPQLRAIGIAPEAVRWVVLTHLHIDHVGGLAYFANAEIVVSKKEYSDAIAPIGRLQGYLPQHWPTWFTPRLIEFSHTHYGPFVESFALTPSEDIYLVATAGHTAGHLSLIVQDEGTAFFFAGDASYTEQLMLQQIVDGISPKERIARQTLARILQYVQSTPTVYLPSHDPGSAQRLAARQIAFA